MCVCVCVCVCASNRDKQEELGCKLLSCLYTLLIPQTDFCTQAHAHTITEWSVLPASALYRWREGQVAKVEDERKIDGLSERKSGKSIRSAMLKNTMRTSILCFMRFNTEKFLSRAEGYHLNCTFDSMWSEEDSQWSLQFTGPYSPPTHTHTHTYPHTS